MYFLIYIFNCNLNNFVLLSYIYIYIYILLLLVLQLKLLLFQLVSKAAFKMLTFLGVIFTSTLSFHPIFICDFILDLIFQLPKIIFKSFS